MLLIICIFIITTALLIWKVRKAHSYWTIRGVPQGKQVPIIGDNYGNVIKTQTFPETIEFMYNKVSGGRYHGLYQFMMPSLCVKDPELLKLITIKDFDSFCDHCSFIPEGIDPIWNNNLLMLKGDRWRQMRATLSPAFTSSKMKAMFHLMVECAEQFTEHFVKADSKIITVELMDIFTKYTNDVIATCAFGIKCNTMENENNEFYKMGKQFTDFTGFWRNVQFMTILFFPKVAKLLRFRFIPENVANFFTEIIRDTIKYREENNIVRPDMINLLMDARKGHLKYEESVESSKETGFATVEESSIGKTSKVNKEELTDNDIAAQALIFFFGGFDSSSILLCFMGYELAINPDVQNKLQREVDETLVKCNGKITYEALNKMKYLDMVISESLRKWPGVIANDRACVGPYTIQPVNKDEVPVHLDKGDAIFIPIWGIHYDPVNYPNPNKFDPERFNDENRTNIKPGSYLPFGIGPRNCIGSRFALLETKILYFYILSKFDIIVVDKTDIPMSLSKSGFNLKAANGVYVGFQRRSS